MTAHRIGVLGPVSLCDADGRTLEIAGTRKRALLAMLALRRGRPVPGEVLTEAVWGGSPPVTASAALRVHVGELRKALAIAGDDVAGSLATDQGGYALRLPPEAFDADRFEALVVSARDERDPIAVFERGGEALALWRESPYPELADTNLAVGEVAHLEQLRHEVFLRWADAGLAAGRAEELVGPLEASWRDRKWQEDVARHLMLALYQSGRQVDALDIYQQSRSALLEELGLDPGPDLKAAERAILSHEEPNPRPTEPNTLGDTSLTEGTLIGRGEDVRRLEQALQSAPLVTIVGPPGAGKTSLAQSMVDASTAWIDLAPVGDPASVVAEVADKFEVVDNPLRSLAESVADRLAGHRGLLVLDNAEHLLSAVADLAAGLTPAVATLQILVTSREPLGTDDELVVRLDPLPTPPPNASVENLESSASVQLLRRRIVASGGTDPSPADLPLLAQLCQRVDGLPLAIELVAVTAANEGLAVTSDALLDLMFSAVAPSPLVSAIDRGLDGLDREARYAFYKCSVFPSWFGASEYIAVTGHDRGDQALRRLAAASLVTFEPERGARPFRLLTPLRDFARERVESSADLCRGHAYWVASRVEELVSETRQRESIQTAQHFMSADIATALDWFEAHSGDDLHVQLTAHLWPYWYKSGRMSEGRRRLESALGTTGGDAEAMCDALIGAALLAVLQGDYTAGRTYAHQAKEIGSSATRLPVVDLASAALAWIDHRLEDAERYLDRTMDALPEDEGLEERVMVSMMWAGIAWFRDRPAVAAQRFHQAKLRAIEVDDWSAAQMTRRYEALMLALAGDQAARAAVWVVLEEDGESPDPLARCQANTFMGLALTELGDFEPARPLLVRGFAEAARVFDALSLRLGAVGLLRLRVGDGDALATSLLVGWLDSVVNLSGATLPGNELTAIEDARQWACSELGSSRFDAHYAEGAVLLPGELADRLA